jgi:hypothetical protein
MGTTPDDPETFCFCCINFFLCRHSFGILMVLQCRPVPVRI